MGINANVIDVKRKSTDAPAAAAAAEIIPDILRVDFIDEVAQRKISRDSLKGERNLAGIRPEEFNRAMNIMDEICKEVGYESPSRRILKTLSRISPVVESHGFMKKNREFEKKWKIEGNVQEQKSIQIYQGTTNLIGGAASLVCKLLGAVTQLGIFTTLGDIPQYGVPMFTNYFDAKRTPLSHEQSFFLNTTQAERQAIESLKQLPESLRNLALELMRLKVREAENIFQR
jgi:hypothetical protein